MNIARVDMIVLGRYRRDTVLVRIALGAGLLLLTANVVTAQTPLTLPNTGQTTTLTAAVSEQARITVPAGVTFNVTNITASTTASNATVTVQNIVLATATKQLRVSVEAASSSFTPSVAGATTWSAADVSWTIPNGGPNTWINGTRTNGTLSSAAYSTMATCDADTASCSSTGISFVLAAKSTVKRSGAHTLVMTWKFEAIGT